MPASRTFLLSCLLLLTGATSGAALAATGGVIHFQGMIVEPLCDVSVESRNVVMACHREGRVQTRTIALNNLTLQQSVPNVATMELTWINPARTLGVLNINYY